MAAAERGPSNDGESRHPPRTDARRLSRSRHPDERDSVQPLHPGVARVRFQRSPPACDPDGLRALVHQRLGGHGDGATEDDPRLRGFPDELFAVEYPAPGDAQLAGEITELVKPTWVGHDRDSWGIDHGAWSVLAHAFPSADIPVVQLSVNALKPFQYHIELGAKLASLRDRGVLVLTSGNIVHNLAQMDRKQPDTGYPWVRAFDDAVREAMTSEPGDLPRLQAHQYFSTAVPTPDHFLPVLYIAGLAASEGAAGEVLVDGCAMGSLSMTAYTVGWQGNVSGAAAGVQVLPPIPPDESNM